VIYRRARRASVTLRDRWRGNRRLRGGRQPWGCELCDLAWAFECVTYFGTFGDSFVNYEAALL
jgi:hypothetical protein